MIVSKKITNIHFIGNQRDLIAKKLKEDSSYISFKLVIRILLWHRPRPSGQRCEVELLLDAAFVLEARVI